MLDPFVNQAAGLQALALQRWPRLVTLVSHGRQSGELPLLWGLCSRWVDMGLSVLVLDGHAQESAANPGLAQQMDNRLQHSPDDNLAPSWQVLPASTGFRKLPVADTLVPVLAHLFTTHDMILIYADAPTLTRLLAGQSIAPQIVLAPAPTEALSAYAALKQLLQARLHPQVVSLVPQPLAQAGSLPTASARQLTQCARSFMGYQFQPRTVVASNQPIDAHDDLQHLALELFENALSLEPSRRSERVH